MTTTQISCWVILTVHGNANMYIKASNFDCSMRTPVTWSGFGNMHPDSKVHGANMGPTWVLSAPDRPHKPCSRGEYLNQCNIMHGNNVATVPSIVVPAKSSSGFIKFRTSHFKEWTRSNGTTTSLPCWLGNNCRERESITPDSNVHGANMGLIWGQQDPGGPHIGPTNFAT